MSLHGQDIERIDLLGQLCRELKILYLQNNVIGRLGARAAARLHHAHKRCVTVSAAQQRTCTS